MDQNAKPSERVAVVAVIDPDAASADTFYSDYFALKDFRRFMAIVAVGDMADSSTVNARFIGYSDQSAGTPTNIGTAITELTQAGTDADKQAVINLNTDELAGGTSIYGRLQIIVGTDAVDCTGIVLGFDPVYFPASDYDVSSVDEIV
jgi:hypothetical protein